MDWIESFYTQKSQWLAMLGKPSGILAHDQNRVTWIHQFCGVGPHTILELGCGDGETALACALAGHRVTAIELSAWRVAQARAVAHTVAPEQLTILEGDFYHLTMPHQVDLVCYWDGFGVGTDTDQRRLLQRIATDWLAPEGSVLLEIFNPWYWMTQRGVQRRFDSIGVTVDYRFDPFQNRFSEHCTPDDPSHPHIAQTIRCYSPMDLQRLLDGTGLMLDSGILNGESFGSESHFPLTASTHAWWTHAEYVVKLVRTPT